MIFQQIFSIFLPTEAQRGRGSTHYVCVNRRVGVLNRYGGSLDPAQPGYDTGLPGPQQPGGAGCG